MTSSIQAFNNPTDLLLYAKLMFFYCLFLFTIGNKQFRKKNKHLLSQRIFRESYNNNPDNRGHLYSIGFLILLHTKYISNFNSPSQFVQEIQHLQTDKQTDTCKNKKTPRRIFFFFNLQCLKRIKPSFFSIFKTINMCQIM